MNAQFSLEATNGLLRVTVPAVLSTPVTVVPSWMGLGCRGLLRRAALDEVAFTQEGDLFGLGEVQVEDRASRSIRNAPGPPDGRRDRRGAAAREHVFVVLPVSVAIAGRDPLDRALRKDVGAGRDLDGGVRVVGGIGDVVKGPAFFAEILSQEQVVRIGEFLDSGLQKLDRVDGSGPAINIGIRPGLQPVRLGSGPVPDLWGTTQTSFAASASGR